MLSTKHLFEMTDVNKNRLKFAGKLGAAGAVGWALYNSSKGNDNDNDVEKPDNTKIKTPNYPKQQTGGPSYYQQIKNSLTSPSKTAGESQGFGTNPGSTATGPKPPKLKKVLSNVGTEISKNVKEFGQNLKPAVDSVKKEAIKRYF